MPDVQPPELASLIDLSERPRAEGWSLRAALCRYAQPQPQRVSDVLDLVRRIDVALHARAKDIERDGPALWQALQGTAPATEADAFLVGVLGATGQLDELGDTLAGWAVDPGGARPDATVDTITAAVAKRLEELGVPHEERTRPPRQRG